MFELPDEELQTVAVEMSKDLRSWIFANFEVTDDQKEYYEKIPQGYNLFTGWQASSAVINRDYVDFGEVPASYTKEQKKKRTTKTTVKANVSYSESSGWGGSVGVGISF